MYILNFCQSYGLFWCLLFQFVTCSMDLHRTRATQSLRSCSFHFPPLSCQQKSQEHNPSHELRKEGFCTVPFCLPIHDRSCVQGWAIKFVSEFSFIFSFLFASISSLSTSDLALITVPWFLFPSWPFPPVFLTPFLSQALQSLSVPLIHNPAIPCFHLPLLVPALPTYPLLCHSFSYHSCRYFLSPWPPV